MKRSQTNYESQGKNEVIHHIANLKHLFNYKPKILDFYGNGGSYNIFKKAGLRVTSIDDGRDFKTIDHIKKAQREGNKGIKIIDLKTFCCKTAMKFDIIFLDYCGLFNDAKKEDLLAVRNILAENQKAYIFFTFMGAREQYGKGKNRQEINKETEKRIIETLKSYFIEATSIHFTKYESNPKYEERKSEKNTPMNVWGFEVIKH